MALTAGQVESVQLYSGIESQVVEATEGTSISANAWYIGDLVKFAGDGKVDAVASTLAISGIAGATCTGVDNTKFDLFLLDPAAIYVMRIEDGEESALAYVGEISGVSFTLGLQRIDISETTTNDIYIIGVHPSDVGAADAGVNEGRLLVRFCYGNFIGV